MLFESICLCFDALVLVLIPCEFGQQAGDAFGEVDDVLSQLDFYLLPIEIQRMLPKIIMYAQEPLVLQFFGSLCCTRDQFKKVNALALVKYNSPLNCLYLFSFRLLEPYTNILWYFVNFTNELYKF